jgi:hypothetical protein
MTEDHRAARPEADPDRSLTKGPARSDIGQDLTADIDITRTRSTEDTIMTDRGARITEREETPLEMPREELKSQARRFNLLRREEQRSSNGIGKTRKQHKQPLNPHLLRKKQSEEEH